MIKGLLLLSFLFALNPIVQSQSKKGFKEGYIIREGDTVKCKVHNSSLYESVIVKFRDSKFEEPIMYGPGGLVSGFGIKIQDSVMTHYCSFPVIHKEWLKKRKEIFFGQLYVNGYTKLLLSCFSSYSSGPGYAREPICDFYFYKTGAESSFPANKKTIFESEMFEEEFISKYAESHPEIIARLKKKEKAEDLIRFTQDYNLWYAENKKKR